MRTRRLSHGRSASRWLPGMLAGLAVLLLFAGCHDDEITSYRAPKSEAVSPVTARVRKRLLAVMIPHDKMMWVVKLAGPEKQVEPFVDAFDHFVQSIKLTNEPGKPITWKLPEGWSEQAGGNKFRYATLLLPGDDPLEATVTHLDKSPLLPNVNRWRNEIGLGPIQEDQVDAVKKDVTIDGVEAKRIDMVGALLVPTAKKPAAPMFDEKPGRPIKYKVPEGWKEQPAKPGGLRVASFEVEDGGDKAEVTVIPLPGDSGSTLDNVNRWREQVGLKKIDEEQLKKDAKTVKVGGAEGTYVNLVGPKNAILGIMVRRGDRVWFIKMSGPRGLVGKQEAAFMEFSGSIEF